MTIKTRNNTSMVSENDFKSEKDIPKPTRKESQEHPKSIKELDKHFESG